MDLVPSDGRQDPIENHPDRPAPAGDASEIKRLRMSAMRERRCWASPSSSSWSHSCHTAAAADDPVALLQGSNFTPGTDGGVLAVPLSEWPSVWSRSQKSDTNSNS